MSIFAMILYKQYLITSIELCNNEVFVSEHYFPLYTA